MNKILLIGGPTATGKTELAISLAKKFDGEIVSADSRQVYKGLDIITGKDLPPGAKPIVPNKKPLAGYYLFDGIPVWMLDVALPDQKFNVADYYHLAWKIIEDIWQRGKLVIVAGGTGFYLQALMEGLGTMGVKPDWELRESLAGLSVEELKDRLKNLDPLKFEAFNESDRQNPRRLIRAIEIAPKKPLLTPKSHQSRNKFKFKSLMIGLTAPLNILYKQIDKRVEERVKIGAEKEIKKLLDEGYDWGNSVLGQTIGYCEWQKYFEGQASKQEVIQQWKAQERAYARRQMTWFKKALPKTGGKWFDITISDWQKKVEKLVDSWYI